jgi:LPXTG-site transpeptidase (sortase) family protein
MSYFTPIKYIKDESRDPIYSQINVFFTMRTRVIPLMLPLIAMLLLVTQIIVPLIFFTTQDTIATPVYSTALGAATGFSDFTFSELSTDDRVLGKTSQSTQITAIPKYFNMTIPKLGIENALVETNAPSLSPDFALGHYANSALPGEVGNSFIYGHSVLPIFYNPKNYKTIFSTLHKLEKGDEFYVYYNGEKLTYKVEGKRDLKPELIDPLAEIKPRYLNESTMILMTCSPPGTTLRRLLVDTVLIKKETIN